MVERNILVFNIILVYSSVVGKVVSSGTFLEFVLSCNVETGIKIWLLGYQCLISFLLS